MYNTGVFGDIFHPIGRCHCWRTFQPQEYHQPSIQRLCVNMKYHWSVIFVNLLFCKLFSIQVMFLPMHRLPKPNLGHQCFATFTCLGLILLWLARHWWVFLLTIMIHYSCYFNRPSTLSYNVSVIPVNFLFFFIIVIILLVDTWNQGTSQRCFGHLDRNRKK